ncbi:MAG: hypothetical protein H0W76_10485 [Pyrinomonadaceae bacterium]|nr:hypothetical protein [Pyrinomonadaceae bacterium]
MMKCVSAVVILLLQVLVCSAAQSGVRFEVSFDKTIHPEPITGRVILIVARTELPEPRLQLAPNGVPIFGVDAENLQPGQAVVIDQTTFGHPVDSRAQLPAGDYYVQAVMNVYEKFQRSDGRTVWLHWDAAGRFFNSSPGNLYSDVRKFRLDPAFGYKIDLRLNHVIPPVEPPKETKWVKRVRLQSESLSRFWGRPVRLGATVILPKDYDKHPDIRYPVVYAQGFIGEPAFYFN